MAEEDPKEIARIERKRPEVDRLLRQFLTDGPKGASRAYKRGWARNFGRKTGEHSGDADPFDPPYCSDEFCWCHRGEK